MSDSKNQNRYTGLDRRAPRSFAVTCAVALALVAPWIAWNASHDWVNVLFTVRDRQGFRAVSATHAFNNMTIRFLIFDAAFIALTYLTTIRRRYPLLPPTMHSRHLRRRQILSRRNPGGGVQFPVAVHRI